MKKQVIQYTLDDADGLDVILQDETVWLTQAQMADLFDASIPSISIHIKNIFDDKELERDSVVKEYLITASDGKRYRTKHYNLDMIISVGYRVNSKRGVAFRRWATQELKRAILEANNPELTMQRAIARYRAMGKSEEWIQERLKGVGARNELTDEWHRRGITKGSEFGKLTAAVHRGTFEITPTEHKQIKGIRKRDNLRDVMNGIEVVLISLAEMTTAGLARQNDAQGYEENLECAIDGGEVGREARLSVERRFGMPVITQGRKHPMELSA